MMALRQLVQVSQALKAALDTADANNAEARHLFERLRDNALLLTGALLEGVGSPKSLLDEALGNIIGRVVSSLSDARYAVYRLLLVDE